MFSSVQLLVDFILVALVDSYSSWYWVGVLISSIGLDDCLTRMFLAYKVSMHGLY